MADSLRKVSYILLVYQLILILNRSYLDANLAYRRKIEANTTCGDPPEQYYETWQDTLRPHQRRPFTCNATSQTDSHPASYMVDGLNSTHWQSKASLDVANITIDLTSSRQRFVFVKTISIQFGAYQRPGQILYSKSSDGGLTYTPWHRFVTYPFECQSKFGVTYADRPFFANSVLCRTFLPSLIPEKGNETVTVDLYGGRSSRVSTLLQQWMNATHIRLQFTGLYKKFDIFSTKWHHYTVREINVTGSCFCNGHASECSINSTSGDRSCQCQNNACGPLCDRCCPAFNQYPWKQGTGAPFEVDRAASCQPCNCHNHASTCVYNQTVANARTSLNTTGFYSGGGVCQSCQHNTTGINCEKCITFLYRPVGKSRLLADVCKECNCSSLGSRNVPGVPFLDCIRDETINVTGMIAGDCYCKQNVQGRKCDVCKPTFYNLSSSNPQGCQDCLCHTPGTVNASSVCTRDNIGLCPCKRNTEGRACNNCKDQFFNLTSINPNGCQDCNCDPGGRSSPICNKTSGECRCKSTNITGRMCDAPKDGFYFPNLHYLRFTVAPQSETARRGAVHLPTFSNASGAYYVIIKYRSTVSAPNSRVTLAVPTSSKSIMGAVNILSTCASSCFAYVDRNFTLTASADWNVFIALTDTGIGNNALASIQIENFILVPIEFRHATVLGLRSASFLSQCDILTNNFTRNGLIDQTCVQGVFSLTMGLLGNPFACGCNATGSINNVCAKYEGQCRCKPGVTGRQCDTCMPGYFNFTSTGCKPCNCSGANKVCNATTGQCVCPANTVGRTCNECASLHWGWNTTTGCMSCGCNNTGSTNLQCDLARGNCSCKYGVSGEKCNACLDTFTGFSASGCSQCNCSANGSNNAICDKGTGQCSCKANTVSRTCGQCRSGSFYLSGNTSHGCLSCICMGITTNCSSNQGYYYKEQISMFGWRIGNETRLLSFGHSNSTIGSSAQSIPAMAATIANQNQALYWTAPNVFNQKSLVHSYGGFIEFSLTYTSAIGATNIGTQNVVLKGNNVAIYQNISLTSANVINVRRLRMHEASWRYANGSIVSRSSFLLILAKPSSLLISASSYGRSTNSYTTRIGGFSISNVNSNVTAAGRALKVERCQCGTGYTGSSCERCAPGYKRRGASSHSYLGTCTPCECNGHSNQCDPDTGKCLNCQHNATGDSCNQCLPGFYGNATAGTSSDCQRCPCDAPRTTSSLCAEDRNGTVRCLNCSQGYEGATCERCSLGYYGQPMQPGGQCQLCQCNNNSEICNTTSGVCQNCRNNTSGNQCERCRDGWYGDAILRTCQACNCNLTGSVSNVCNHTNGQCVCHQNVIGMNCTACRPNSYGFNSSGCTLCGCNPSGSVQLQCNETGYCECQNHTVGKRCDACTLGYYGLPLQQCQACNCNETGRRNASCSTSIGQCFCKPGVQGRECGSCQKQYYNFTDSGCTACGPCSMLLQRKINTEYANIQKTQVDLQAVRLLANLTPTLVAAEQRYNATQVSKQQFESRMAVLQAGINRIRSDSLSRSVNNLNNRANQLVARSVLLTNTSSLELRRIQSVRSQAERAARFVMSVNTSLDTIITSLQNLNRSADLMLANSQGLNFSFAHQRELAFAQTNASAASALLVRVQSAFSNATIQRRQVDALSGNVTDLIGTKDSQSRNVTTLRNVIVGEQERLRLLVSNITLVQESLQSTNVTIANISIDFSSLGSLTSNISVILNQTERVLQSVNETINNATGLKVSLDNLSLLVGQVQTNLTSARTLVSQATGHAANLTTQAANLTGAFAGAKAHGANAVNAVGRYESISRLINQSLEVSAQANRSVQEVLTVLQQPGNQNITRKATTSLGESRQEHTVSVNQQNSLSGLQQNASQSNGTYESVKAVGNSVSSRFGTFISLVNSMSIAAEYGTRPHSLEQSSSLAISQSSNITNTSSTVINESRRLQQNITRMAATNRNLNRTSSAAIETLNQAWATANNITNKLNSGSNSPMDNINNITRLIRQFNTSSATLDLRLSSIQSKLAALKQRMGRMQTAIKLNGSNSVAYKPAASAFTPSAFGEMRVDFKTTQRNAMLMHFGNSSASSTRDRMALKIVDSKVVFEYTVNGQQRRLTNWEVGVSDGFWRRVLASRQGDFSRLTVSVLAANYSRTYSSYVGSDSSLMTLPADTSLYIGALPASDMINATAVAFDGCIDNVFVNKDQLSLWNYTSATYKPGFCNSSQTVVASTPSIQGASFAGNGFVQLRMGNFSIQNYSRIEFNFRTFHQNGTLFAVRSARNAIVFSIILLNGNIIVFKNEDRFGVRPNTQSSGSYADGKLYRLIIEKSTYRIWLSATSVTTGAGPAPFVTNVATSLLEEGNAMFFGGVNATLLGQLNTGYNFAGCISNVSLSNNATGGMDSIRLNDARLRQYSKGAAFDGCLAQIQNGARFLGNGYASATTPSQRLSNLRIEFKTTQPNGVIFYSEYKGAKFYIALFHGNIFLDYKNSSRNARVYLFTRDQTLNDGQYHTIEVVFSGTTLMRLQVDNISMTEQLVTGLAPSVELNGRMYFGGVPTSLSNSLAEFPVSTAFIGDMRRVVINGIEYLKSMISVSEFVSLAGVSVLQAAVPTPLPTTPPPTTLPPTCAAGSAAPQYDPNTNLIGINTANSTLALRPPNEQVILSYLRVNYLITIEFRAFSPYGVVFFATNTSTGQFISLELVDGKLVYQFNTGGGLVQMTTTQNYAQGQWIKIYLLRVRQFGALLISSATPEYHNNRHGNGFINMELDFPFYFGSIPNGISVSMLRNPSGRYSFRGCIRDFRVQDSDRNYVFNWNTHTDLASSRNVSRCYTSVVPMIRITGTGYIVAERNLQTTTAFSVSIRFRTSQRYGILWHLVGNAPGFSLLLEQISGQVILTHTNARTTTRMVWIDPDVPFNRGANMSYFLCNNAFHTLTVGRSSSNFTITVDSNPIYSAGLGSVNVIGTLYVGGTPSINRPGLTGCLQNLVVNGQTKDLVTAASSMEATRISTGCSAT